MRPITENILISFLTGLIASASMIQASSTNTERDWIMIASTGVIAFGGSLINGMRQLHKDPPAGG